MIASPQGWRWLVRQECVYYLPELLEDKASQTKMGDYDTLSDTNKQNVIKTVKQEYLAYLFLHNSNGKMHSQLKKDVAND
jgi:hypothetical protein